jgi:hypothetical protein
MITQEQALALKVNDPVTITEWGQTREVTVSFADGERLHLDDNAYQFILPNCQDGIEILSLPEQPTQQN